MCACTEPVRTGIDAVFVEYGRPKWPIAMLNKTDTEKCFVLIFSTLCSCDPRLIYLKAKNGLGRFAPSALPHYEYEYLVFTSYYVIPSSFLLLILKLLLLLFTWTHCYNAVMRATNSSGCASIMSSVVRTPHITSRSCFSAPIFDGRAPDCRSFRPPLTTAAGRQEFWVLGSSCR